MKFSAYAPVPFTVLVPTRSSSSSKLPLLFQSINAFKIWLLVFLLMHLKLMLDYLKHYFSTLAKAGRIQSSLLTLTVLLQ